MTTGFGRLLPCRMIRAAIAGGAILAAVGGASADDDSGVHAFFQSMFGSGAPSVPALASGRPPERPDMPRGRYASGPRDRDRRFPSGRERPLTVRLRRGIAQPTMVADVPTKPAKVSIYQDRTLRRGDAVMTAEGIRVFAGSRSWPYTKADFVGIGQAKDLNLSAVKVLAELNSVPRT